MEDTEIKRTDKTKKKSAGYFYAEWKRWRVDGKSSKDLKSMIVDLKSCIRFLLFRIKRLKYVIQKKDELIKTLYTVGEVEKIRSEYRRKLANQKSKVRRREGNLEKGEEERGELLKKLKLQERENAKLNRELEKKDDIISEVKARKRKVIVKEKVHPLSKDAKRLERIASKPINEKHIDTFGVVAKTEKFRIENKLTANHLIVLLRADTETYVTVTDMKIMQKKAVAQLVERGLLAIQKVMRVNHYYPTVEGKELLKKYRDYISYGNNPILKNENT